MHTHLRHNARYKRSGSRHAPYDQPNLSHKKSPQLRLQFMQLAVIIFTSPVRRTWTRISRWISRWISTLDLSWEFPDLSSSMLITLSVGTSRCKGHQLVTSNHSAPWTGKTLYWSRWACSSTRWIQLFTSCRNKKTDDWAIRSFETWKLYHQIT